MMDQSVELFHFFGVMVAIKAPSSSKCTEEIKHIYSKVG